MAGESDGAVEEFFETAAGCAKGFGGPGPEKASAREAKEAGSEEGGSKEQNPPLALALPVATIFAAVTPIFAAIPPVLAAVPAIFAAIEAAAIAERVTPVFAQIAPILTAVATVLSPVPAILDAVTPAALRCRREGGRHGQHCENQRRNHQLAQSSHHVSPSQALVL
jgi:hypothetical protein